MTSGFAEYFNAVIDWEKRLAREMPLLEEIASRSGARLLLPACGTGGHLVALALRGFRVFGFDADEDAVAFAQRRIEQEAARIRAADGEASVSVMKMEDAAELGASHDAAFCLGNALPGISGEGQLLAALKGVAGALRTGGVLLTQNLNYDLRWKEKAHWFPLLSGETGKEEVLLVKFAGYEQEIIDFHTLFLVREKGRAKWKSHARSSRQAPLFRDLLAGLLTQAGFGGLQFWGDYAKSPFDETRSNDLLAVAEKL